MSTDLLFDVLMPSCPQETHAMQMPIRWILSLMLLGVVGLHSSGRVRGEATTLYVGTYTRGTESRGIYVYRFDDATGALEQVAVTQGVENPSFLAVHPNGKFLYSSDEIDQFDGERVGTVSAFAIDPESGELALINQQAAGGTSPCHLVVDPAGQHVLVVGYGSGTVAVLPIDEAGRLQPTVTRIKHTGSSVDPARQASPHPHQIVLDRSGRFALVPDLGLDQIVQYRFDGDTGRLTANEPSATTVTAGAGPRHLAFDPEGRRAYVINELDLTVSAFDYHASWGVLSPLETVSAVADGTDRKGLSGAEIAVHPSGKFLYASLRGVDEIVVFRIDPSTGRLQFVERVSTEGQTPRNFALDPSGKWLLAANQNSGSIVVFRIGEDGRLELTPQRATVPSPVCLEFIDRRILVR